MVNHSEEDSIRIHPPNQDIHNYCGPGQGLLPILPYPCGGPLECWFSVDVLTLFCLVELVEEIDGLAVFEVVAVCEELYALYGVIILSFCLNQSRWFFHFFNPGKHCFSFN